MIVPSCTWSWSSVATLSFLMLHFIFGDTTSLRPSFLPKLYRVLPNKRMKEQVSPVKGSASCLYQVRQVPGDGGCMFHALATCLDYADKREHFINFDPEIRRISRQLRELAVSTLQSQDCSFALQEGDELRKVSSIDILNLVAQQYNITADEYCSSMLHDQTWGGGPELMALAHALKTPIHVYELQTKKFLPFRFYLKPTAKFEHIVLTGNSSLDGNVVEFIKLSKPPLEILFTDGRFPHLSPWKRDIEENHFLALFPVKKCGISVKVLPSICNGAKEVGKYMRNNLMHIPRWLARRLKSTNKILIS